MNKALFENFVETLYPTAKKDNWVPIYDPALDYFTWAKEKLSTSIRLIKVSNEAYFYITPERVLEGVVLEYLTTNFMEHNYGLEKEVLPRFKKEIGNGKFTTSKKSEIAKMDGFLQAIRADIWKEVGNDKKKIRDLDNLIQAAIAV